MVKRMDKTRMTPQVKICGITKKEEAAFLNEAGADYAGFVFFPKSKRNVTFAQAKEILQELDATIKKVAVFVSPTLEEVKKAEEIGIDILQIHGTLSEEIRKKSRHPIWRAVNIKEEKDLAALFSVSEKRSGEGSADSISGIVVDGAEYGSGKPFDWKENEKLLEYRKAYPNRKLVLAGGLNGENVKTGISIFAPDIVDVSSGVENENGIGKNRDKILEFVRKVKEYE